MGESQVGQAENTEPGILELVKQMQELEPELIVVEATDGYQRAVVNPSRVRQFKCIIFEELDVMLAFITKGRGYDLSTFSIIHHLRFLRECLFVRQTKLFWQAKTFSNLRMVLQTAASVTPQDCAI